MFKSFQVAICTAFAAASLCAAGAHAQDAAQTGQVAQVKVQANVDFDNPAEVRGFYDKLRTQVRYMCDSAATYDHDYDSRQERACETQGMSDAVHQVAKPQLSRLYNDRDGRGSTELGFNNDRR